MRNSIPSNNLGITQDQRRPRQVIKQPDPRTQQNSRNIHMDLIEQPRIEELLNRICAMNTHRLPVGTRSRFGLLDRKLNSFRDEVHRGVEPRPAIRDMMGQYKGRPPRMIPAPALRLLKSPPPRQHRPEFADEPMQMISTRLRHMKGHGVVSTIVDGDITRGEIPVEDFVHAIFRCGDKAVERHGHESNELGHGVIG